jgi:hypothetical protein
VEEKEVEAGRQEDATYGRPRVLLRLRVSVAGSDGCGWLGSGSDGDRGEEGMNGKWSRAQWKEMMGLVV